MAVKVRFAKPADVKDIAKFGIEFKEQKQLEQDVPADFESLCMWLFNAILLGGNYVFLAEDESGICGFIVLTEITCPWSQSYRYGADILFVARKGGLKLVRTAKEFAKKRNWKKLMLSTTTNNERSDKFLSHVADKIGGVYNIKV